MKQSDRFRAPGELPGLGRGSTALPMAMRASGLPAVPRRSRGRSVRWPPGASVGASRGRSWRQASNVGAPLALPDDRGTTNRREMIAKASLSSSKRMCHNTRLHSADAVGVRSGRRVEVAGLSASRGDSCRQMAYRRSHDPAVRPTSRDIRSCPDARRVDFQPGDQPYWVAIERTCTHVFRGLHGMSLPVARTGRLRSICGQTGPLFARIRAITQRVVMGNRPFV